ncbi:MAG: hypothetical protein M0R46_05710 [Candidatus Muirbacterium halophilum]|nr:hypothetical protein [Candidatus Muirbacterium halophilum]MCK9475392.1 hypothetical protein [Candidatus Muirbacterium halophilum]
MSDKKIQIEKKKGKKKSPLDKLNLPKKMDEETQKKLVQALKEWLRDDE